MGKIFCRRHKTTANHLLVVEAVEKIYVLVMKAGTPTDRKEFEHGVAIRKILEWGRHNNANSVLWVIPADIFEIHADIPSDAEPDEALAAFTYELASMSGMSSDSIRPSIVLLDAQKGISGGGYCSGLPADKVNEISSECRRFRIKFHGVAGLQQLLFMNYLGASDQTDATLLLFLRDNAFLANFSGAGLSIRNIPFGMSTKGLPEAQWHQKLQRRLDSLKGQKIKLYLETKSDNFAETLEKLLRPEKLDTLILHDVTAQLSRAAIDSVSGADRKFYPALPRPKAKDPREAGTRICLFMIGATLVALGFQYAQLKVVDTELNKSYEKKSTLTRTLKSNESQVAELQEKIDRFKNLCQLLESRNAVAPELLNVLKLLSRYRLKYTKINSIKQQNNGIILIGETYWQPDLSKFFSHFEKQLGQRHLALFSEGLKNEDDGRLKFQCRISSFSQKK